MVGNLTRQPRRFAPTTQTPALSRPAPSGSRAQAEGLLRDLAFVLHLTRSVRQEILGKDEAGGRTTLSLAVHDSN